MSFESLERFLEMGGYAMYVFGSYGITAIVMVGLVVTALKQHRAFFEKRRSAGPDSADSTKGTGL
ncbi:MAG: heme exporter protein CcmD [Pseudomonadales bacterium]